jgi:SNF2 family DNA or RNA helicase
MAWAAAQATLEALRRDPSAVDEALADAGDLSVLDEHQRLAVAAMVTPGGIGCCVFDEQGTGKTVVAIHAFDVLVSRGEIDRMLIVAPKSMLGEWARDLERFTGDLYRVSLLTGARAERTRALGFGADVVVAGYEAIVADEPAVAAWLRRPGSPPMLVVDESFQVKNRDARRSQALLRLREWCERAYVLCGSPAPNAPIDVVSQIELVDFGQTFAGVPIPRDRDAARVVVRRAMQQRGVYTRHLKRDVLPDLPPKRFTRVTVPFEPTQREAYAAALNDLILDLRQLDRRTFPRQLTSVLARRAALLRICANPASVIPGYSAVPAKLVALDQLLAHAIDERGEKAIVWCFYRASLDGVVARYARYNPVRFDGSVTDVAARREAVRRFQDEKATMLFVANPAAAGAGLTLHSARLAIYESLPTQAAHFLQSVDRIHRRGQRRDVELVGLVCEGSIEQLEFDRLETKAAQQRDVLGDPDDAGLSRDALLAELMAAQELLGDVDGRPS